MQARQQNEADPIQQGETGLVRMGNLTIDLDGLLITLPDGTITPLTLRERDLLRTLLHSPGRVLSYATLGREAWHYPDTLYSLDGIRCCICRLRRKLGQAAAIESVRGVGYRFRQDKPNH